MSTGVIAVPAAPWDPDDAQVVADGWFPAVKLDTVRYSVRLGKGTITTQRLTMAIEGGMLHAFRELADWRTAKAAAGIAKLEDVTADQLNGANLAVKLWERIVTNFAAADLYASDRDVSATDQGLDRAAEKDTAADEARRIALGAVADLRSIGGSSVGRNRVRLI
ncbi:MULTISPECIES: head completion/stabilization protein [unclassified Sphingomonas]|uniref:head completion/stabilization protein n=1 Tax=Novosphingobium rhizosphaerae TaxID=1551649 RepID=UPI0015CB657B